MFDEFINKIPIIFLYILYKNVNTYKE